MIVIVGGFFGLVQQSDFPARLADRAMIQNLIYRLCCAANQLDYLVTLECSTPVRSTRRTRTFVK